MRPRVFTAFLLILSLCVFAIAQAEKPKPIITVTKTDNTTVRGRMMAYDRNEVTMEVGPKAGEGETVVIPWTEINKVSSGLTHARALEEWRTANADKLCTNCRGDATLRCKTCHGTGHDHAASDGCQTCKGEGDIECKEPKCNAGKIICPGRCIKLSQGRWVTEGDKKWLVIRVGKDELRISEAHIGEVSEVVKGELINKGKCPTCHGTTEIECTKCEATGRQVCPTCRAKKDAPDCPACEKGRTACTFCNGTGMAQ